MTNTTTTTNCTACGWSTEAHHPACDAAEMAARTQAPAPAAAAATTATPIKLRSGQWGARTPYAATVAATKSLTVTTRAGKSWNKVYRCESTGPDHAIWAPVTTRTTPARHSYDCQCGHCDDDGYSYRR